MQMEFISFLRRSTEAYRKKIITMFSVAKRLCMAFAKLATDPKANDLYGTKFCQKRQTRITILYARIMKLLK